MTDNEVFLQTIITLDKRKNGLYTCSISQRKGNKIKWKKYRRIVSSNKEDGKISFFDAIGISLGHFAPNHPGKTIEWWHGGNRSWALNIANDLISGYKKPNFIGIKIYSDYSEIYCVG